MHSSKYWGYSSEQDRQGSSSLRACILLGQGLLNFFFSLKSQRVNILGLVSPMVYVAVVQLCFCSEKGAVDCR